MTDLDGVDKEGEEAEENEQGTEDFFGGDFVHWCQCDIF